LVTSHPAAVNITPRLKLVTTIYANYFYGYGTYGIAV